MDSEHLATNRYEVGDLTLDTEQQMVSIWRLASATGGMEGVGSITTG